MTDKIEKKWTVPNASENLEQQELSLLVGMQNGRASLEALWKKASFEDSLAVSYKFIQTLTA